MLDAPLVSVLMSVHNDRATVGAAAQSILAQSHRDFEFIIIDDGSSDGSADVLRALDDPRVRVLSNASNLGLTRSLNLGLCQCRGRYVARMDADDVSLAHRLATQTAFLEARPEIGIVGSARELIDESGSPRGISTPPGDDLSIRWRCLLGNPFGHPTVMIRRGVLLGHGLAYDESFRTAQDYELWTRLLTLTRGANLAEPLVRYRVRECGVSRLRRSEQLTNHDRISLAAIRRLVPDFTVTLPDVTNLRGRFGGYSVREEHLDPADARWVGKLIALLHAFARQCSSTPNVNRFFEREIARIEAFRSQAA